MSNFEKEIYTSLEEAKEEIWKRWENKRLKGKVVEFMGDVPDVFSNEPKSVLFRHIISPNNELLYFGEQSVHINLKPICIEYLHDKLCTWNHDKLYLAKMPLFKRKNKHGEIIFQYKKIADIQKYDGRDICDVETN